MKLVRLLFDFGTTDDDCKQNVPTVALGLQQLTTPAVVVKQQAVLILAHILYLKPKYFPRNICGGSECSNKIRDANFLIVFDSNYGSIYLAQFLRYD